MCLCVLKQVFAGMLTGAIVCGGLTDTYGRRPVSIMSHNESIMAHICMSHAEKSRHICE